MTTTALEAVASSIGKNRCSHPDFGLILRQTVAELFDFRPAGHVLRTFMQYSIAFCNLYEVGVVSGARSILNVHVVF